MRYSTITILGVLTLVFVGFQNCSEVAFGPSDRIQLVEVQIEEVDLTEGPIMDPVSGSQQGQTNPIDHNSGGKDEPPIINDGSGAGRGNNSNNASNGDSQNGNLQDGHSQDGGHSDDPGKKNNQSSASDNSSKERSLSGEEVFTCVLEGPGSSVRLGAISEKLLAIKGVPNLICMTKLACEEIVSQKFVVKSSFASGFCGKNPNVIVLSDDELQSLMQDL